MKRKKKALFERNSALIILRISFNSHIIQEDVMFYSWSFYSLFKPCYNTETSFFTA